jgi:hypothetical protein
MKDPAILNTRRISFKVYRKHSAAGLHDLCRYKLLRLPLPVLPRKVGAGNIFRFPAGHTHRSRAGPVGLINRDARLLAALTFGLSQSGCGDNERIKAPLRTRPFRSPTLPPIAFIC